MLLLLLLLLRKWAIIEELTRWWGRRCSQINNVSVLHIVLSCGFWIIGKDMALASDTVSIREESRRGGGAIEGRAVEWALGDAKRGTSQLVEGG